MKRPLAAVAVLIAVAACDNRVGGLTGVTPTMLPASRLVILSQPSAVAAGAIITPAIQVSVQTSNGVTVSTSTATITVALTPNTGTAGAVLSGTGSQEATDGVAIFNNLRIDRAGTGYTLVFSSPGLASANTAAFDITQ